MIWSAISTDRSNLQNSEAELGELTAYSKQYIQPLQVFTEPPNLVIPGPSLSTFIIFEFFIFLVVLGYFSMVYFIIKDDVSEVFDCVLLRRTDAEEPLIDDEAREDEYQRADEAQDDYYKKPDQDQLLSAPHV